MAATDYKDYYQVLGVGKNSTPEEIKQAYRRLARKYHPDMNPGNQEAEKRFKEINEAHEILSDPDKRQKYDRFGQYWQQAQTGGAPSGFGTEGDFAQYGSFDDFINELLGRFGGAAGGRRTYTYSTSGGGGGTHPATNRSPFGSFDGMFGGFGEPAGFVDAEATLALSMSEAFHGVQKQLQLDGEILNVRIPAGAKPGSRIRLKGKGRVNPATKQRGDLYLTVELTPHRFFHFEGDDLVCEVPIAPDEAALGAKIEVPTPDGKVTMTLPAGVQSGQSLRLRGKGWPRHGKERGDQLIRLKIVVAKEMSSQERECYEQLRRIRQSDPRISLPSIAL
jgi:curved DNA-binding protein